MKKGISFFIPAVFLCLLLDELSGKDTGISKYSVARRISIKGVQ
jgi:hypothetical protein